MMQQSLKELKNRPHFSLVTTGTELAAVCRAAQKKSAVALDTEFVRVSTYFPKLGLIQLYDGEQVSLIDPLPITDFSPFIDLLKNPQVTKILHACSEDLLVFLQEFDQLPIPMIDTQIMAKFLNIAQSAGLATLISHYFGMEIDKGATRTNWMKRPLSAEQLQYAANDVWYLLPLYQRMADALNQTPWQQAVIDDCNLALKKCTKLQDKDPDTAYLDIPNAWKLDADALNRLKFLAKWRQQLAMERDLALSYVVKADNLWKVSKFAPKSTADMLALGLHETEVRIRGKKMLQILNQAAKCPPADYPPPVNRLADFPLYKKTIKALQQRLIELTPLGIATETLGSKRSLESLMKWHLIHHQHPTKLPDLLIGWRKKIGEQLLETLKQAEQQSQTE